MSKRAPRPNEIMRALEKEYARQRVAAYPAAKRVANRYVRAGGLSKIRRRVASKKVADKRAKAEAKAQNDFKKAVGHFAKWQAGQEAQRLKKERALLKAYKKAYKPKSPTTAARNLAIRKVAKVRADMRKRREQNRLRSTPMMVAVINHNNNAENRRKRERANMAYRGSVFGKGALYN